jgi:acetyl-CoA carboxylase biotin carboxyl carrier protein
MKAQDIADLKQLIEFLKEHQVGEFEVDRGDLKIKLKFKDAGGGSVGAGDLARLMASVPQTAPAATHAAAAPAAAKPAEDPDADLHMVKSPIVGTYYGSPSPGASPFVAVGDKVDKGQVICIVEAMKLMNEIESDAAGEIVKCFVTNGQAIEYGQPLFSIRA